MIAPDSLPLTVRQAVEAFDVSELRACQVIGQPRSAQRYDKRVPEDEALLSQHALWSHHVVMLTPQFDQNGILFQKIVNLSI